MDRVPLCPPNPFDLSAPKENGWQRTDDDIFRECARAIEKATPTTEVSAKRPRKRRRQSATKISELTPEQTEAMHLIGEHKGNVTNAAKAAGKIRQAMRKLYDKALKKLGQKAVKKPQTNPLRTDHRGQDDVTGSDDHRE